MNAKLTPGERITLESYDRVAHLWEADHWTPKFWQENFDTFYERLPEGRVLEIGCGAGRDAQELIAHGYEYVGTDIAPGQVELAKKNNPGPRFEVASIYDLDFEKPFDGFWCAAMLIHVPKERISEALQSVKRNLVPRAVGFIAVKEGEGERMEVRPELDDAEFMFTYWQDGDFSRALYVNGFQVDDRGRMPFSERTTWLNYHVRNIA